MSPSHLGPFPGALHSLEFRCLLLYKEFLSGFIALTMGILELETYHSVKFVLILPFAAPWTSNQAANR